MYACIKQTTSSNINTAKKIINTIILYKKDMAAISVGMLNNMRTNTIKTKWIKICPANIFASSRTDRLTILNKYEIVSTIIKKGMIAGDIPSGTNIFGNV